jgi:hypothetical protein
MTRLVQLQKENIRRVALVEEPQLRLLSNFSSIYELTSHALQNKTSLHELIPKNASNERLDYDPIYQGNSAWRVLTPIDHPAEAARCLVSGTGLTHLGSAKNRAAMHNASEAELSDSMKMFRLGVEHGKPAPGQIGAAPEWFYKGPGTILRAHNGPLDVPPYAEDGGEEGEIAGIYMIDPEGAPVRIGMCIGNEFSDHKFEKKNYLNLAGSKIRTCSLGAELVIDPDFQIVPGEVTIQRGSQTLWKQSITSGEKEMVHTLANLEHHHFKFESHRRPGDIHVHYYGACALSFGAGIEFKEGDLMQISFQNFGRPLRNPLRIAKGENSLIPVRSITRSKGDAP